MRVIADIDEADIGNVKEGQRVSFSVDAFPEDTFQGLVTQVRQEATTESNVVTYEVVISAPNKDLKLKPGLTANVTVYTQEAENVLAVPAKAIRFSPKAQMLNEGETLADCNAATKVWVREGNVIKATPITTGISNGTLTEVTSGLQAGTEVITDINIYVEEQAQSTQQRNPFMPGPPNKNKQNTKK